jgi:hypothetical protein
MSKTKKERLPQGGEFVTDAAMRGLAYDSASPGQGIFQTASSPYAPNADSAYRAGSAQVMVTGDAAVAKVSCQVPAGGSVYGEVTRVFGGSGASKRERGDDHDRVTGECLALGRAYAELSARLLREARRRIRAQDAERHQKATRRTRGEWEELTARVDAAQADLMRRYPHATEDTPATVTRNSWPADCFVLTGGRTLRIENGWVNLYLPGSDESVKVVRA